MARKSRRVNGNKSTIDIGSTKTPETCAGVYLRLSAKDSADKDSIQNQKAIIQHYLETKPDIKVFKYYIDDGVSCLLPDDAETGVINQALLKIDLDEI